MGRTSDARNKILTAARSLIEERGYSALGVAEICKTASVPKGSFYYFFDSKEALALAVIDQHWADERREWEGALNGGAEPLQRLRQLFESMETQQRAGKDGCGSVLGCMFGNLSLEMSNQADAVRRRLQEIFETQVELVAAVVTEARRRGDVTVTDARAVARSMVALTEGQVLFAKLHNDPAQLGTLWPNCRTLLGVREQQVPTHV
ncbi:TetR/AcrR family transcriptional regulator [Streptomyces fuscichromogenes]|uniref:TetR family transcriptional regulator n=1 Tax=Streptomyces fuscichromogenes TaxID=1324013 RepID=A0A918CWY9_9ACTN|nr:TetR/AcrR family transcriptional regulator [Streptomyces fuscichromogenes]GGN42197.1 TetR family transcriptional regulator [Streptomyces fuscichromogenes]